MSATMTANAGGPLMTLRLVMSGLPINHARFGAAALAVGAVAARLLLVS
jgi:hypothetical protein